MGVREAKLFIFACSYSLITGILDVISPQCISAKVPVQFVVNFKVRNNIS
jgi:hypothetical protein